MEIFLLIMISLVGTMFGSFASVVISRIYNKESGIMGGRSHCTKCGHILGFFDLFPIFSYIFSGGKCRYCKTNISIFYPVLEILMGFTFFLIGIYTVNIPEIFLGNKKEIFTLLFFLFVGFVIVVFSVYDYLYQLIPTEILSISILSIFLLHIFGIFFPEVSNFFDYYKQFENNFLSQPIVNGLFGALFIYIFFYLQIFLPGTYYAIEKKKYKIIISQIKDFFILPLYMLISLFIKETETNDDEEDEGIYTGIGHGDLWIAVFMGLVGGFKIAVLGLAIGYLIGAVFGIYILFITKKKNSYIAFGPFLGIGLLLSLFYYDSIINLIFSNYI